MAITLRTATAEDQPAITALIKTVQILQMDLKWQHFVVAVDDATGAVVATGQIKEHGDGSHELASIGTLPEYRHQGLAHQIIARLIAQHPATLYLTCLTKMGPLYEQFGFKALTPKQYTPYFRRLAKLANVMQFRAAHEDRLLVMRRDGDAGD